MPGRSFFYRFHFVFANTDKFDEFNAEEYKGAASFAFKSSADKIIAFTKVIVTERMSQIDILDELKSEFTDDMRLNLAGMEDDEGGEDNE